MNDLDRDVDAVQMTHSDEPTTKAERGGMLLTLEQLGYEGGRLSDETARDFTRRLIAHVERLDRQLGDELTADSVLCPHAPNHILEAKCKGLDAELHDSAKNVLSLSASLGKKIERVSELEAEVERLRASLEHIAICDYALPCEHHQLALVDPREQASAALVGTTDQ